MSAYTAVLLANLLWFNVLPDRLQVAAPQFTPETFNAPEMLAVNYRSRRSRRRGSGRRQMLGYKQDFILTDYADER